MVHDARAAVAAILLVGTTAPALPARATAPQELEVLSDRSADERSGIALAEEQASRGEWLEALATLERVLAANPKSRAAKLLHASYLCRVDDRTGGAVELGKLRTKDYAAADLAAVRAQCSVPRRG